MRLLITGAAGMLGRDVARAAESAGHEAIAVGRDDLDVTDAAAVRELLRAERPGAVVNCAAWTDVDGAEAEEARATAVNGAGAGHVAAAAAETGARLLHVSTDYVFDGTATRPYVESATPAPLSAYGRSKLAGERAVLAAHPGALVVRSSWLFGAGGRNFVETMLRLGAERPKVTVVDDQVGCPTFTGHLAGALVGLAERGAGGVHHLAGGGSCSWFELAREIFRQADVTCEVEPGTTAALGRPAPRPAYSVLASERADTPRLPDWRRGLAAYLVERAGVTA